MHRPPGLPFEHLDTPCLIVDMDAYESNLQVVADTYRDTPTKMRAHTKNLKSPFLAQMQINIGGTVGGVCVAKVSEAEVMVQNGITDILIPNQVVTDDKLIRLCGLARRGDIKVCVDDPENVRAISRVAESTDTTIGILVEVDTSMGRAGVRHPQQGVEIAKLTNDLPNLRFMGRDEPPARGRLAYGRGVHRVRHTTHKHVSGRQGRHRGRGH